MKYYANISDLIGVTFSSVESTDDAVYFFTADNGPRWKMYHQQDCCESVYLEDICGDLDDLVSSPILSAEEVEGDLPPQNNYDESYTWTFYKLSTIKGSVTFRWYGSSNGYYSERADLFKVT